MGMIQTMIKKVPDTKTVFEYLDEVRVRLPEFSAGAESAEVDILSPAKFDEVWTDQDNLKDTPEIKDKYRRLTETGRVIYVEIDW
jgi:hypothetical protein